MRICLRQQICVVNFFTGLTVTELIRTLFPYRSPEEANVTIGNNIYFRVLISLLVSSSFNAGQKNF